MKTILKDELLVLVPENAAETSQLENWKEKQKGYLLEPRPNAGGLALFVLGRKEDLCREPINVTSTHPDPTIQRISNFAETLFVLDEVTYTSVEAFWQSLRFSEGASRRHILTLSGPEARRVGQEKPYEATIEYNKESIPVGTWRHWQLMERACLAKFTQDYEAMAALLSTGDRPLINRVRQDSKTIPGVIMADIWMRIRRKLQPKPEVTQEPTHKDD